jgi:glucose-induced degradation protein 8
MKQSSNNKPKPYEVKREEWLASVMADPQGLNRLVLDYLVHEGLGNIAAEFARNTNTAYQKSPFLMQRTAIRSAIEKGDVDLAIMRINDLNAEIIDSNVELYYFLMQHKACEQAYAIYLQRDSQEDTKLYNMLEEILEFIRSEVSALVEENPHLTPHLEDLLEYVIFNSKEVSITERRRQLAEQINEAILDKYDVVENELKSILSGIIAGEKSLAAKYKFQTFKSSFM